MYRRLYRLAIVSLLAFAGDLGLLADDRHAIFEANRRLGHGVNFGNALEANREGDWGLTIEDRYLHLVREAGFDSIRLPVRWSAHAAQQAPYTIDPQFFQRIDHLLDLAEQVGLNVVLNIHHYEELDRDPDGHEVRFLYLWRQISSRYASRPPSLYMELYNEPHGTFNDEKWNSMLAKALAIVRQTNPQRPVIVGPPHWNGIWALPMLKLPDDPNLIVTVHYYNPHEFTHQGAHWADERIRALKDRTWPANEGEVKKIADELEEAAAWGKANNRPIYLGEFGSFEKAPFESRLAWTAAVRREAEARQMSWSYWEFGSGFGVFQRQANQWNEPLLRQLSP